MRKKLSIDFFLHYILIPSNIFWNSQLQQNIMVIVPAQVFGDQNRSFFPIIKLIIRRFQNNTNQSHRKMHFWLLFTLLYQIYSYLSEPSLTLAQTLSTPTIYDNMLNKLEVNEEYVVRLSNQNEIQVWEKNNQNSISLVSSLVNLIGGLLTSNPKFIDFSLGSGSIVSLLTTSYVVVSEISNQDVIKNLTLPQTGLKVEMTPSTIYVLTNTSKIIHYKRSNYSDYYVFDISSYFTAGSSKISTCHVSSEEEVLSVWDQNDKVVVYSCNTSSCDILFQVTGTSTSEWNINEITFSSDCQFMLLERDERDNIRVFSITNQTEYRTLFNPGQTVYRTEFYQEQGKTILVYLTNNTAVIHSIENSPSYRGRLLLNSSFTQDSFYLDDIQEFVVGVDQKVDFYSVYCPDLTLFNSEGLCYNCTTCNYNQTCGQLIGQCEQIENTTDWLNYSAPSNQSNGWDNSTTNQNLTNNTFDSLNSTNLTYSNQTYTQTNNQKNYAFGFEQIFVQNFAEGYFSSLGQGTTTALFLMQLMPLAVLFLSFINYWSICSLYALVEVTGPQYLKITLKGIYETVYFSFLDHFGVKLDLSWGLPDKASLTQQSLSISTLFLPMNFENLVKFGGSLGVAAVFFFLKDRFSRSKINVNKSFLVVGQLVTIMPSFVLPSFTIMTQMHSSKSLEKANTILNLVFTLVCLIVPFVVRSFQSPKKDQVQAEELSYFTMCNSFLPLTVITGYIPLFLVSGSVIFIYGIYVAQKHKKYRLNKILLTVQVSLFHVFFICLYLTQIFDSASPLINIFGISCTACLLIGTLHQIFNLLFQAGLAFRQLCRSQNKVSFNQQCSNTAKTNNKSSAFRQISEVKKFVTLQRKKANYKWSKVDKKKNKFACKNVHFKPQYSFPSEGLMSKKSKKVGFELKKSTSNDQNIFSVKKITLATPGKIVRNSRTEQKKQRNGQRMQANKRSTGRQASNWRVENITIQKQQKQTGWKVQLLDRSKTKYPQIQLITNRKGDFPDQIESIS